MLGGFVFSGILWLGAHGIEDFDEVKINLA
jgi:hypothetical protein